MIKYLINLILILFLFSCNELNLNNVSDVVENSTNKIEEIIDNKKEDKKENKQSNNKQTKDNIFYYVGEPYFIEGVSILQRKIIIIRKLDFLLFTVRNYTILKL